MISIPFTPTPSWFASLEFPIDPMSYELIESSEDASDLIDHVYQIATILRLLKEDGWNLELELGQDESTYTITHPRYSSAFDANTRLTQLGITRLRCHDVSALLAE